MYTIQGINLVISLVSLLSGVRLVSCHSAVRLRLLLSNATVSMFVLLYLITKLFRPTLLLHSGHFPPYTIIPPYRLGLYY